MVGWGKHGFVEKSYSCFQLHYVPGHAFFTFYIGTICYKDLTRNIIYCILSKVLVHCYIVKIELVSLGNCALLEVMACSINIRNRVVQVLVVTGNMLCL